MELDPNFTRLANERLWADHPELGGRLLTGGPGDAALRGEWMRNYKDAAGATPPPPAAKPAATPPPAPPAAVLPCPGCGPTPRRWLCIQSNTGGPDAGLTDGHANLSLHEGADLASAKATTYGSWPDDHPAIKAAHLDNGPGSDIRVDFAGDTNAARYPYKHCREITPEQYKKFQDDVAAGHQWGYSSNCSQFASTTFHDVTGVDVSASDNLLFNTPRAVGNNILDLNGGVPSNFGGPTIPAAPGPPAPSSGH